LIALSANAWIGDVEIRLAYDNSPGRSEREFFQAFGAEGESGATRFGRPIDCDATFALIVALANHAEQARLRRAAEQYRLALSNWLAGHEVLAIAHLWIAVEALTKVAIRRALRDTGAGTTTELAEAWGVPLKELDGEIRRRMIFRGDADAARKAREASDGIEHGYLDFGVIRELSGETRKVTAACVRGAIFEFADLGEPWRGRLLEERYSEPLRSWIVRYLRGRLVGDVDDLAAPGEPYPTFIRTKTLEDVEMLEDGSYHFQMVENFRAPFSEGVEFQGRSFEV
jgi:hypothetical protein